MLAMFGQVLGVDEDVIYIDDYEAVEILSEHFVHETLEDGW